VDPTDETIQIPRQLLQELTQNLQRVEEILATLEELGDTDAAENTRRAEEDIKKGRYKTAHTPEELDQILR